jgi:hypothetical protein
MSQLLRKAGTALAAVTVLTGEHVAFAQDSQALVSTLTTMLIGVSVLLIAVSFVFVMTKLARLVDLFIERLNNGR